MTKSEFDNIPITESAEATRFENYYMNRAQMRATIVDPNVLIAEIARAGGKTDGISGPRIIRVADGMPCEISFLIHRTYAALFTNVVPNILAFFSRPLMGGQRTILEEGKDYIVGSGKIPGHFKRPRRPIPYPKHSILFRNGHSLQLVSSDQPESAAGQSAVHAFVEEMKHQKGEKIKTRIFPALRGAPAHIRNHPLYQGITGVSDTARVDLGEDNWFEEYEKHNNSELVNEIANVFLKKVNRTKYNINKYNELSKKEKNPIVLEAIRLKIEKERTALALWEPRLSDMRRNAHYFIRASSFVNKDYLGPKFFKTQFDSLNTDEFLTAICAVRQKAVADRFFINYNPSKHQYSDGYRYNDLMRIDLKESFRFTSSFLRYYDPYEELLLGYDPGNFSSVVVAQENRNRTTCRILKEFFDWAPRNQTDIARAISDFFGDQAVNRRIRLYYDRAGNKRKEEFEQILSDAKIMQRELESYGFSVELMNEGQKTIYHWQQFKLLAFVFSGKSHAIPRVLIDENECKNLCSAIMLSPRKYTDGKIELDKTSERKVALHLQAGLTTQLPSAFIYLLYGLYSEDMPSEYSAIPDNLPDNSII